MDAHVGCLLQPAAALELDGFKGRDLQAAEKVLFDVADAVFDAAFFVGLARSAGTGWNP